MSQVLDHEMVSWKLLPRRSLLEIDRSTVVKLSEAANVIAIVRAHLLDSVALKDRDSKLLTLFGSERVRGLQEPLRIGSLFFLSLFYRREIL